MFLDYSAILYYNIFVADPGFLSENFLKDYFISETHTGSLTVSPMPQGLPAPVSYPKLTIKFPVSPDRFF